MHFNTRRATQQLDLLRPDRDTTQNLTFPPRLRLEKLGIELHANAAQRKRMLRVHEVLPATAMSPPKRERPLFFKLPAFIPFSISAALHPAILAP